MAHIEFLDPVPDPDAVSARAPRPPAAPVPGVGRRLPSGSVRTAAVAAWLGAAALAWAAAYSTVYTVTYGSGPTAFRFSVDAWGRDSNPGAAVTHQHAARFALLLGGCAVVLAGLAAGRVVRARRPELEAVADGVGLLAVGVLAGTLAAMYLQTDSVLSGLHSQLHIQAGFGDPVRGGLVTRVGPSPYLALAALVCAAAAAGLQLVARARQE